MLLLLACLFVFGAIALLVLGLTWKEENAMEARMAALRGERPATTYQAATQQESIGSRVLLPLANSVGTRLGVVLPSKWVHGIERELVKAGEPVSLNGYLLAAILCAGGMTLFGFTILTAGSIQGQLAYLMAGGATVLGFVMPKIWLSNRVRARQKTILKSLPDAYDLITTCVEAGLGLDAAMAKVAEKVEGPFGEELAISLREIPLGKLRRDALKELAERIDIPDLSTFVNAVVQAESMGTSIATVLRVQAEQMRVRRRQRAEQQAQQAPVKMIFPLVLCIFPTLFIVILGPAAINIYETIIKD